MSARTPANKADNKDHDTKVVIDTGDNVAEGDGIVHTDGPERPALGDSGVWGAEDALDVDVEVIDTPTPITDDTTQG